MRECARANVFIGNSAQNSSHCVFPFPLGFDFDFERKKKKEKPELRFEF
jgi:hypothetical protein